MIERYIHKNILFEKLISDAPENGLTGVVIIPAYNEPDILATLYSLRDCSQTKGNMEVIVLFNHAKKTPEEIQQENRQTFEQVKEKLDELDKPGLKFYPVLVEDMPNKHQGAGLARKVAMDEAVRRLHAVNNPQGYIVSLDADCAVSGNYLVEIEKAYGENHKLNATIQNFEHPLDNMEIAKYELYLRYFKQAVRYTGFPYAYHTIGSCFSVKMKTYVAQGGMNRKQGGEDFYFLQKVFPLGQIQTLNALTVYPSSRFSDRVPFGTGPALSKIANDGDFVTYHPVLFEHLKVVFDAVASFYNCPKEECGKAFNQFPQTVKLFMGLDGFCMHIQEINNNSASQEKFVQRFYSWFNAFFIIKYLNAFPEKEYRLPVEEAAALLLEKLPIEDSGEGLLETYKALDRA